MRFTCEKAVRRKKDHLVNWDMLSLPKDGVSLAVGNTLCQGRQLFFVSGYGNFPWRVIHYGITLLDGMSSMLTGGIFLSLIGVIVNLHYMLKLSSFFFFSILKLGRREIVQFWEDFLSK